MTLPNRLLVIDETIHDGNNLPIVFRLRMTGRHQGKWVATLFPTVEDRVNLMQLKDILEKRGIACHTEFQGKTYRLCTMMCQTPNHQGHTLECKRRRK